METREEERKVIRRKKRPWRLPVPPSPAPAVFYSSHLFFGNRASVSSELVTWSLHEDAEGDAISDIPSISISE